MTDLLYPCFLISLAVGLLFVFHLTANWAFHGEGYWPRGFLGIALALVFVIGIPCCLVFLLVNGIQAMGPWFWWLPPLRQL